MNTFELFGGTITQHKEKGWFSATDLVRVGNSWRIQNGLSLFRLSSYFIQKGTIDFVEELKRKFGEVKDNSKGRGHHTWVHPLLFLDIARAISPKLKAEVYCWFWINRDEFELGYDRGEKSD